MKVFGLSPASVVLKARHAAAEIFADDGDDFATSVAVAAWPAEATADERAALIAIWKPWGWTFGELEVVSALGLVRKADAYLPSVLALDRTREITVVNLRGWREWSGHTVAQGLVAAGFRARAVDVQMQATPVDASPSQVAARFDDEVFRNNLMSEVRGAQQLLLPPVLGTSENAARLQAGLGCPVGEGVATLPSLAGEAQLRMAREKMPAGDAHAEVKLVAALETHERVVIASRRAAAWLERCASGIPPHTLSAAPLTCGRAQVAIRGLGAEWLSALRLAATLGTP